MVTSWGFLRAARAVMVAGQAPAWVVWPHQVHGFGVVVMAGRRSRDRVARVAWGTLSG